MEKNYSRSAILLLIFVALCFNSCNNNASSKKKLDRTVMESEKPAIDTSRVLPRLDLYRAKRFESVHAAVSGNPDKVYKLVLWGKKLGVIPPAIRQLTYLHSLDVSHNDLKELPEELAELHYLQGFYAVGNQLTEFPRQIILLPVLDRIDLSENQIREIPGEIARMQQLRKLNLYGNSLSEIPPEVYQLENLEILTLGKNDLAGVSPEIANLKKLRKLDLSENHLKEIPWEVTNLQGTLTDLEIQGNEIPREEIERLIEKMPSTNIRF